MVFSIVNNNITMVIFDMRRATLLKIGNEPGKIF